ncbi:hypothetical protein AB0B45_50545 [Nonomuraea sp. NPDC049152]|uniref:hypothetical protein n=1 Tax=Nonomuraea sp. NPDC049152 TaxID=3154350 RepID=UPI0033D09416
MASGLQEEPVRPFKGHPGLARWQWIIRVGRDVRLVAALADADVAGTGAGGDGRDRPYRSGWTWQGRPLPFVPYDNSWAPAEPEGAPVSGLGWYERSLAAYADRLPAAAIPVEKARADLVLIAGGADRMWPSLRFARGRARGRPATT